MHTTRLLKAALLSLIVTPTLAHHGETTATLTAGGFLAGLLHPFSGLDHVVILLLIGAWTARRTGPAAWSVPTLALAALALGAALPESLAVARAAPAFVLATAIAAVVCFRQAPTALGAAVILTASALHSNSHADALVGAAPTFLSGLAAGAAGLMSLGMVASLACSHAARAAILNTRRGTDR